LSSVAAELEPEQEQLLAELVESERDVPRDQREWWVASMAGGDILIGPWGQREVPLPDVYELEYAGLLRRLPNGDNNFVISPQGRSHYAERRHHDGAPAERVEVELRRFLDDRAFRAAYPAASGLWSDAEALLWPADSDRELTTIGHKAREAMQMFATEVVERYKPPQVDPDPANVKRRLGAVIAMFLLSLGEARADLLKALGYYSEATMEVIQRQEHGGQKEAQALTWEDARRVVFHVAVVMFEFAATLDDAAPEAPPPATLEPS
jgi:hypothetical protein